MLSLDVIAENASAIANALDALRGEHQRVLSRVSERTGAKFCDTEKLALVQSSLEKLELGLDEAKVSFRPTCSFTADCLRCFTLSLY